MDEKERQARREGRGQYLAREEQKTIKRIPPEEMDEKERQRRREAAASISNFPPS